MHRTIHPTAGILPVVLILVTSIRADVTAISLSESVQSFASDSFFGGPQDSDQLTSTTFPPVSLQVTSSAGLSSNRTTSSASITITSYSGPMAAGASTPGLSISGSTSIGGNGPGSWSAGAVLRLFFDLDQSQPFSFTGTGTPNQQLFFARIGSDTIISPGSSGMLDPGSYELTAGRFPSTFNLVITPEPTMLSIIALAGMLMLYARPRAVSRS